MSQQITVVHIAAVPTATQQRCLRCCGVLVELKDPAVVGSCTIASAGWEPGGFVGVIDGYLPASFPMSHDARLPDERNCAEVQ